MSEATASINDAKTGAQVPVDGIAVTTAAPNPSAGQAIRQAITIGDGTDNAQFARVETQQPSQSDPALITRGYVSIEDVCAMLARALHLLANPPSNEPATGRTRVTIDAIAGSLTLGTITNITNLPTLANVTTVAGVTNQSQMGGQPLEPTLLWDTTKASWAALVRSRVS